MGEVERLHIVGGRRLAGAVRAAGAKNGVLPILSACLLTDEECVVLDVPDLTDVAATVEILRHLGAEVARVEGASRGLRVRCARVSTWEIPERLVSRIRSSVLFLGPLLARLGRARLCRPGGCFIGSRPIDLHLKAMRLLGASVAEEAGFVTAEAEGLRGAVISLDQPSVGATENALLAAVVAEGVTVIRNAAREPEVVDLAVFLSRMGARIAGAGTDRIRVEGVERLGGAVHRVIPDRIEAGTYLMAGAITGGDVIVTNVIPRHLSALLAKLREMGVLVEAGDAEVRYAAPRRPRVASVRTQPYPGFPTDLQNQYLALLSVASGRATVAETVFEQRLRVAGELARMGASIAVSGRTAFVRGVPRLRGAMVHAPDDLRGSAALVLAGLAAAGATVLCGLEPLDRGYEDLEGKLRQLGARLYRLSDRPDAGGLASVSVATLRC